MSTNYYFFTKDKDVASKYAPDSYTLVDTPDFGYEIHIGKRSAGWLPLLQAHKQGMCSVKDFKDAYNTGKFQIYNENMEWLDWDTLNEELFQFNGGRDGVIPKTYHEVDKDAIFYDPDMPCYTPVSHFTYGNGKHAYMYFKDPEGFEFSGKEFL